MRPIQADKSVDDHALIQDRLELLVSVIGKVEEAEQNLRERRTKAGRVAVFPSLLRN